VVSQGRHWLRVDDGGKSLLLNLHIQPGAKQTAVAGVHGEALKIRLAAPPVDGKANDCLINFLAEKLAVAKAQITLVSGASSRSKRVRVTGVSMEAAACLQPD
jgi:uncharacterized protein (TIGR00251 family)